MDEVMAMSRAGESVGKAVGTGVRSARHGASRASKVGAEVSRQAVAIAEQELASRGISTDDLQERIAQRTTGMSRKELAKRGKQVRKEWDKKTAKSRKQLAKNTKAARKELAHRIDPVKPKRRKWPWFLLVLAGMGAAAAGFVLSRRPEQLPVAEADNRFGSHDMTGRTGNGAESASADGQVGAKSTLGSEKEH